MLQWFKNKGARSAELGARVRQGFEVQTAGDLVQAREIYRPYLQRIPVMPTPTICLD